MAQQWLVAIKRYALRFILLSFVGLSILQPAQAGAPIVGNADPIVYKIELQGIEYYNNTTKEWIAFDTTDAIYDIKSVSPGQTVGHFGAGHKLSPGTYNKIAFLVSRKFTVKGSISNPHGANITCITKSNLPGQKQFSGHPIGMNTAVENAYLTGSDGIAEEQTANVPTGDMIELPSDMAGSTNTTLKVEFPIPQFAITGDNKASPPRISFSFDTKKGLDFVPVLVGITPRCIIIPTPPEICATLYTGAKECTTFEQA